MLQNLVNHEVFESNKTLAGYGMNKGSKNSILFMKEEVIKEHLKFLMEAPVPVYEPEPEPINIDHADLTEAEYKIIEIEEEEKKKELEDKEV